MAIELVEDFLVYFAFIDRGPTVVDVPFSFKRVQSDLVDRAKGLIAFEEKGPGVETSGWHTLILSTARLTICLRHSYTDKDCRNDYLAIRLTHIQHS